MVSGLSQGDAAGRHADGAVRLGKSQTSTGYLLLALLAMLPVLAVDVPPLVDYPNHLARMHALARLGDDPVLQGNYVVDWRPLPNLAMDLIVVPLAKLASVVDAGRLFLLLAFAAIVGGVCALYRAVHGRLDLWPATAFLVLYNLPLAWGFVNFYFSVGLFLLVLAGWISTRKWPAVPRLLLFSVATAGLYLSHLFGFAAFVLAAALFECHAVFRSNERSIGALLRRGAWVLSLTVAPALLYLANGLFWDSSLSPLTLGSWYGDVYSKLRAVTAGFLFYGGWPDVVVLLLAATALVAVRVCGRLTIAPPLRWLLTILVIAVLVAPHVLNGIFLDARIGVLLACLLIAALRVEFAKRWVAVLFFTALVGVFAVKMVTVQRTWATYDAAYDEFRQALQVVEPGVRVLSAHDVPDAAPALSYDVRWRMALPALSPGLPPALAYRGLINLAVIERGAFVPSLFTYPSAQPLRSAPRNLPLDPIQPARRLTTALLLACADEGRCDTLVAAAAERGERVYWASWPARFDYVVVFRYAGSGSGNPAPSRLESAASGSFFDIYRVRKP